MGPSLVAYSLHVTRLIIIIIIMGFSSVSWSEDYIRDAPLDNGFSPCPPRHGERKPKL